VISVAFWQHCQHCVLFLSKMLLTALLFSVAGAAATGGV
jgi:hypothetical protein